MEVGERAHKLHFQIFITLRWPNSKEYVALLAKHIKNLFPEKGKGYRVAVKAFGRGQDIIGMLGYVLKDEGRPHYKLASFNISERELHQARQKYSSYSVNIDENKVILTTKNLYKEAFKFHSRAMDPAKFPLLAANTYVHAPDKRVHSCSRVFNV